MVETMFDSRQTLWQGLGKDVKEALSSEMALNLAGLNWNVVQKEIMTNDFRNVSGYKANVRDTDNKVLGIVSDKYSVVQNRDAFTFTDLLLGEGVQYETAGSLQEGKRVWLLARLPQEYIITGERITPYLLFTTTHDGSGAVRIAITPVRVVCKNTLNLALKKASRSFSMMHTASVNNRIQEAHETLFMAENYMEELGKEIEILREQKMSPNDIKDFITELIPLDEKPTEAQVKNANKLRNNLLYFYKEAPDLKDIGNNAYRFINAVSDFATHAEPLRKTVNYKENLFIKTTEGHPLIDKAYNLVKAA